LSSSPLTQAPPIRYVTAKDGYSIAYAVSGSGTPFLFLPGAYEHIQLAWQFPGLQPWVEKLSTRFQLIQTDERGAGMSERGLREGHSMEDYQLDIEAVVDHLNLDRFILYGAIVRGHTAVQYALNHPERVAALILGPITITQPKPTFYTALPAEDWDLFLTSLVSSSAALRSDDEEGRRRNVEFLKQAWDQHDYVLRMRSRLVAVASGVWLERLAQLETPTLVLQPRDFSRTTVREATEVARLAKATLKIIDGASSWGDADQGIRAIETFLAELPKATPEESPLLQAFTGRELEVLRQVARGMSNREIAEDLVLSLRTVERHIANIYLKADLHTKAQATAYAHRHQLIRD
jgi:pimeloyl-ACP methyl ester carboxylesterase/DNA-binding CsgD family transcriptional regulator